MRADALQSAAATQQKADIEVPARRGTISDANGIELAISEPAQTIAATPYLIDEPAEVAAQLARILHVPEDELLRKLVRRDTGFVYLARRVPTERAQRAQRLTSRGSSSSPNTAATIRATGWPSQLLGNVGTEGTGSRGLEYGLDERLGGRDGKRRLVRDALGDTIELREDERAVPGRTCG